MNFINAVEMFAPLTIGCGLIFLILTTFIIITVIGIIIRNTNNDVLGYLSWARSLKVIPNM